MPQNVWHVSPSTQSPEEEWQQLAHLPSAIRLGGKDGGMARQGAEQVVGRKIAPKDVFLIPRLLFEQVARLAAMRCRHVMPHP
jgi:hypothetical protein